MGAQGRRFRQADGLCAGDVRGLRKRLTHKMASERRLRIKTLVMVLAMVVCANAGDLLLKRGMSQIGAVQLTASGLAQAFPLTVASWTILGAILFLSGFILSYITVLSWADYSYVMLADAFR